MTTFAQQAEKWIHAISNRKKDPVCPRTAKRYREALDTHILPSSGQIELVQVGNKAARDLVANLRLAPASIQVVLYVLKAVVKSAVDDEGNQLFPRTWSSDFIDAPAIKDQKAPSLPVDALQKALGAAQGHEKALYALLAGSGLRISEALSLTLGEETTPGNVWDPQMGVLRIRHAKTAAGTRTVDLDPSLNAFLSENLEAGDGPLFDASLSTYRRLLKERIQIADFHRFRRFRVTHLRKNGVPEVLIQRWVGHSGTSITDKYDKIGEDIQARKDWASKIGLGFSLEAQ